MGEKDPPGTPGAAPPACSVGACVVYYVTNEAIRSSDRCLECREAWSAGPGALCLCRDFL